jgi:hypothetical protein
MMSVRALVLLPLCALLLAGCAAKKRTVLDGDTALEMQSSILMLSQDLTPQRRQEFDQAIATIIFSANDRRFQQNGDRLTPASIRMLRGRNVGQVIEAAKLLRTVAAY